MMKKMLVLKYGLLIFAFIAIYFLLMKLFNMENIKELRLLNIIIVIFFTVRMAREIKMSQEGLPYLKGLFSLLFANLLAVVFSVIGLALYITMFPDFVNSFQNWLFGGEPSITTLLIAIIFEGSAAAIIVSFAVMQYYKEESIP